MIPSLLSGATALPRLAFSLLGLGICLGIIALPLLMLVTGSRYLARLSGAIASLCAALNHKLAKIVIWTSILMALVQMVVVIMRYIFGLNFIWLQEGIMYLFAMMFLLSGGYVLLVDEHVRVDLFYRTASPARKALIDLIGSYIFLFPVCLLMIFTSRDYVARSWVILERSSEATGIPAVFILKSLIPIFGFLMILAGISVAHKAVRILRPAIG